MTKRNYTIDFIKALAIISVVLIHALSDDALYMIRAPYYIWQTVPVFMILIGFNAANSFKRKEFETVQEIFSQHYLKKKVKRILLPFTFIWLIQIIFQVLFFDERHLSELLLSYIQGGFGPGSYFVPFIIQATILTPFIYVVLKKNPTKGLILLFAVSLLIDAASYWIHTPEEVYRVLMIRHIFSVTLGVWYALVKDTLKIRWLLIPAVLSGIYITGVYYYDWEFIIEEYWRSQHAPSYFYALLLVVVCINYLNVSKQSWIGNCLVTIGQASFHIFLTQMVYFWLTDSLFPEWDGPVYLLMSLSAAILSGISFHYLDRYLSNKKALTHTN
ncbi:acyltransferase family protein [Alkalibacterium olivapovliticus]|uniref:Fucose 4-O-acetylase-like acetyltransferase n=1 Tax=Alkalibacterium olivapovliticus TaxID=99907 RepID=A0A2T0W7S2_9LACT|nr:acyltransferase [Alkalibacterium olivapovliticus]PRY82716.1 fucose 4-O-acetylase-like acetyltransferase [Alkalibacterium olivapovliticus]